MECILLSPSMFSCAHLIQRAGRAIHHHDNKHWVDNLSRHIIINNTTTIYSGFVHLSICYIICYTNHLLLLVTNHYQPVVVANYFWTPIHLLAVRLANPLRRVISIDIDIKIIMLYHCDCIIILYMVIS